MRSARPKPLHLLCGKAMVLYVLDSLGDLGARPGRRGGRPRRRAGDEEAVGVGRRTCRSSSSSSSVQRGTGDAVAVALTAFPDDDSTTTTTAATCSCSPATRRCCARRHRRRRWSTAHRDSGAACTILTAVVADPTGYGRVVRGRDDRVDRIVEHRDASDEELADRRDQHLDLLLPPLAARAGAAAGHARQRPGRVLPHRRRRGAGRRRPPGRARWCATTSSRPRGSTTGRQLAVAEAELRRRTNEAWLRAGVTMVDPATTYIDTTVRLAADVTLFPGVVLQGSTVIGEATEIGPGHPPRRLRRRRPHRDRVHRGARRRHRRRLRRRPLRRPRARDACVPSGTPHRPALLCPVGSGRCRSERRGRARLDGAGRQEEAADVLGHVAPGAGEAVAANLGVELGNPNIRRFANGEIHCRFDESVRGATSSSSRATPSPINASIMEQLIMIDAAKRASAKRITAVCPYYGYGRQDRKAEGREPITAKLLADLLQAAGADRMVSRRPPLRPDPGLLRPPRRPPHGHAGAARVPRTARCRAATSWSCRPTPGG